MANHQSAKKRIRQIRRRSQVNRSRLSRMRTYVKKVEAAIESGDAAAAKDALKAVEPQLMRSAQKGIVHKNTASRKLSRLSARIKSMPA
ncbi:MAG: 30S ribosomal protein S20 [Rhodospirillales bacterium]|nr:30S ribosomal protein S20 [Rhodospirillales bacterium]